MQAGRFLVYGLSDPRTLELRYVGKSSNGMHRPRIHIKIVECAKTHKEHWVNSVLRDGYTPEIDVLEVLDSRDALDEAERFWIAYLRYIGARLTNATDGGDGWAIGDRNPMRDPVANAKHRASMRGKPFSPSHKKNHALAVASNEARERYRADSTAKWQDPAYRDKVTDAVRRALATPEHRMKRKQLAVARAAEGFIGRRFGRLVAVEPVIRADQKKGLWRCLCDCGGEVVTRRACLVCGDTKSCGCLFRERWNGPSRKSSLQ